MKAVYDFPTTKGLIENLKTNPSLRRLCGWEYRGEVPSEATFSRAFGIFAREKVCNAIHAAVVRENYTDKLVGHASLDSTAIIGREKSLPQKQAEAQAQAQEETRAKKYSGESGVVQTGNRRNQNPAA
ncbi:MAG: transposase [Lentisphaeria bacterium]|nr:MAG: transposase [Lentisphaeria bacterium]